MIDVIPGINEKNFDEVSRKLELVIGSVDWVQIDIEDGTLVQNVTYNNPAPFTAFSNQIHLEAHLMVNDPVKYVDSLVKAGFKRLIAQVEGFRLRDFLHEAKMHHVEVGMALNGASPLELIEPYLGEIDTALILTGIMGPSGQPFLQETLPKIRKIHEEYKELPIEVDIGITKETAPLVIENGATRLAVTSYLFKEPELFHEHLAELTNL